MTINLIRHEPKLFLPMLRSVRCKQILVVIFVQNLLIIYITIAHKLYKGKKGLELSKVLQKMEPLPPIQVDAQANQACRQNNDISVANETSVPVEGGNLEKLKAIVGDNKAPNGEEFTYVQWEGTAHELILLNLLQDYEKEDKPAILDDQLIKVGMSFKAHKKVQNVFQLVYLKQLTNQIA